MGAFQPLWRIHLVAPQYREGLVLDMYAYKIEGGNGGQDLAEINMLNHYIGMKAIEAADFVEMQWIPFVIGVFTLIGLRAVAIGRIGSLVDLGVLFLYFGAFSLASFVYRLYTYGHQLDPKAPMTIIVLPEFVARHWWDRLLYNQTARRLKAAILGREHTVIAEIPYRRES